MTFNDLLASKGLTIYSLCKQSGLAKTTIFDIASSKTSLLECKGRILRDLAKSFDITIEELFELEKEDINSYPSFISTAISNVRAALKDKSPILQIYVNQLYSCLDTASTQNLITIEQSDNLKERYKKLTEPRLV